MSSILKGLYETKKDDKGFMPTPRQIPAPPGGHPVPQGYERVKSWGGAYELRKKTTEGEVVSMQARKTPLVVAGSPYDWDVYDLRNNKMVASIIGGDRHDSPLYEVRINSNGMTKETKMLPTYVVTAGPNNNPPYKAFELVAPTEREKIEKSPGPGGTTKLKPDTMDVLGHMAKQTGQGKYYGYDLYLVEEGLDQYEIVEKALGAKIMDTDDAMELGYTDEDPEDTSAIVYVGTQKNEGYTAGAVGGAGLGIDKSPMEKVLEKPLGEQGVAEGSLNELSPETLARYKKAAGADASKADKEGDFERGNKRFSGIVRATKKEFDKDMKKESSIMRGLQYEGDTGRTEWSKSNPPPPELLLNTLIQILSNPINNKSPDDLINLWNQKYGLKHTLNSLRQYAQNDYKKMELSKALQKAAVAHESSQR